MVPGTNLTKKEGERTGYNGEICSIAAETMGSILWKRTNSSFMPDISKKAFLLRITGTHLYSLPNLVPILLFISRVSLSPFRPLGAAAATQ